MCSSVGDPDESLGMAIGESAVQLQQETPHSLGDASTMGQPPRTEVAIE